MADGLLVGDLPLLLQAHKVAMNLNVLFERLILSRDGHTQVGFWAELVQAGTLQKVSILRFQNQIVWLDVGRKRHLGAHLGHVGLDMGCAKLPGN